MNFEARLKKASVIGALLLPWCFALLAALFASVAIVTVLQGRVPEASLSGGAFFLCVVLGYFPQLESVKALSVDVKMRKSLDRADEILERVKRLVLITSQHSLYSMAWAGRFGGSPMREKPELINAVLEQMAAVGLTAAEREEAAHPLIDLTTHDLGAHYEKVVLSKTKTAVMPQSVYHQRQLTKINSWRNKLREGEVSLKDAFAGILASADLNDEKDRQRLEDLASRILLLDKELRDNLIYMPEIAELLRE